MTSLTMWVYLHSFSCCCIWNLQNPVKFSEKSKLQQFTVIQGHGSWCQSKAHMQLPKFLLVINSNFRCIYYCFQDIDIFSAKIAGFPTSPQSEFLDGTYSAKTRWMGLLYGKNCIMLSSTVFGWSTRVTDGQTAHTKLSIYAVCSHVLKIKPRLEGQLLVSSEQSYMDDHQTKLPDLSTKPWHKLWKIQIS